MKRMELEELCAPQTPEETLEELRRLEDLHENELGSCRDEMNALKASSKILEILINRGE